MKNVRRPTEVPTVSAKRHENVDPELAKEFAANGITVNTVIPGAIRTDMNRGVLSDPSYEQRVLDLIPARWIAEPEDVAPIVRFLASEEAKNITGASITVVDGEHGGWYAVTEADGNDPQGLSKILNVQSAGLEKSHLWKASYHEVRALLNVAERLKKLLK